MLVIWLLVLLLGVAYLAHSRTAALPALGITAAYLVAMALFSPVPGWLQLLLWSVTGAVAAFILLGDLRRPLFTRPLFAWFGDLDLVPHLWQMVCLGETEAVVTFFPPVDIDQLGDRKKLCEYCFRQVSGAVQAANSGRYELLPPPKKAA